MQREIIFNPAWDERSDNPSENYGIHGVNMCWYVKGERCAVQFIVYTNWHLPHVEKELDSEHNSQFPHLHCHPQPVDVGYHSPIPMYEEQTSLRENCEFTKGNCYYGGRNLDAQELFKLLVEKGSEAVWVKLEEEFVKMFGANEEKLIQPQI